jgi:hypothetical protein
MLFQARPQLDKRLSQSHLFTPLAEFSYSPQEFYQAIERELDARKVPGLKRSRVNFHEGGMLSDKRVYLRLARERYAFDVCAAPFGVGYFFSVRLVEVPRPMLGPILVLLGVCGLGFYFLLTNPTLLLWLLLIAAFSPIWFPIVKSLADKPKAAGDGSTAPAESGMPDFDGFFLGLPVIGPWYEKRRKDTYYREDTRQIYQSIISEVVKAEVENVTATKGIKLVRYYEFNPLLDLYKLTEKPPGTKPTPK